MSGKWISATAKKPCTNCGKKKRCSISADGDMMICYGREIPGGQKCEDKNGDTFWRKSRRPRPAPGNVSLEAKAAPDEICQQVYGYLISLLSLDSNHRENLLKRGLNSDEIERRAYRTLPTEGRARIYRFLEGKFGQDTLQAIPGIILKSGKFTLGGASGLIIPVRDKSGLISRLISRVDKPIDDNKYLWLSSSKYEGAGAGARLHVPLYSGKTRIIRLTEGQLKADVATAISHILTLGIPGVSNWRMGVKGLEDFEFETVRVSFDADAKDNPTVAQHLLNLYEALLANGHQVEYETWDGEKAKGIDDALATGIPIQTLAGNDGLEAIKSLPSLNKAPPDKIPLITFGQMQMSRLIALTWEVFIKDNELYPRVFLRSGQLVRVIEEEFGVIVTPMDPTAVFGHLVRIADWFEDTDKGPVASKPPMDLARDLIAYPNPAIQKLKGVINTPIFSRTGDLVIKPGYDEKSGLFLDPRSKFELPGFKQNPSAQDVRNAIETLKEEVFQDFPFANNESDLCHCLAIIITYLLREMIDGPTPLFVINGTAPGSGKNLLADCCSIIMAGRTLEARTLASGDDEVRKMITSELLRGPRQILLDNMDQDSSMVHSPALASVLTTRVWTDRLLSRSQMVATPNDAVWLMTGNNVRLTTEIARRAVHIVLQPKDDKPWERDTEKFRHSNLRGWLTANRLQLLSAALILCQSWIASGAKSGSKSLGSFEPWAAVVGGVLENAGLSGFLERINNAYESADVEREEWSDLLSLWQERYGTRSVRSAELYELCDENDLLSSVLGDGSVRSRRTKLGINLATQRGRHYGNVKIDLCRDKGKHGKWYRLQPVHMNVASGPQPKSIENSSPIETFGTSGMLFPGLMNQSSIDQSSVHSFGEQSPLPATDDPEVPDIPFDLPEDGENSA